MANNAPRGIMIAATGSGTGKTTITLALIRALKNSGVSLRTFKSGPDYIDPQFHAAASGKPCNNLDAWAMSPAMINGIANSSANSTELLIVEGAMGLFDAAQDNTGSSADLAKILSIPIVLIIDCAKQAQSVAALVHGFCNYRADTKIAGVILNRVASNRHESMLRKALSPLAIPILGVVQRTSELNLPERHLGLVQAEEHAKIDGFIQYSAKLIRECIDIDSLISLAAPIVSSGVRKDLPPLAQKTAVARDSAFSFLYPHLLEGWQRAGASLTFFSPLANEPPPLDCEAIFLPGGYPELHAPVLAAATDFKHGMQLAAEKNVLIYGECGGYMCLGKNLKDKNGDSFPMLGLLPHSTDFSNRKLQLGYRLLESVSDKPWQGKLAAHEFHYATLIDSETTDSLFRMADAEGTMLLNIGHRRGNIMGSFAHVICEK